MDLLRDSFLQQYEGVKPPFTELGEFVYYRTYSRWLDDKGRREHWAETVARAVDFNMGLELKHSIKNGYTITDAYRGKMESEAEELFDNVFNLRQFLSGRTLWTGGTPVADKFPLSNFNCAFIILDSFKDFEELFYLLMVGTGVGFRVLPDDVAKFRKFRTNVAIEIKKYEPLPKADRKEHTDYDIHDGVMYLNVGDSKEGWVKALGIYFEVISSHFFRGVEKIVINFDSVRPKGERLKTFGGTASGHESLENMFRKINTVIQKTGGKMKPVDALDIANIIGENVVVGGVRRTSEICLFSAEDTDILKAKEDIYYQEDGEWKSREEILHRRMSNNSIFFEHKPTRQRLHEMLESIRWTGEPGFVNAEVGRKRRERFNGVNPCGEVLLDDKQCCNLTTNNMMAFVEYVDGKWVLNRTRVYRAFELSARAGLRMTLLTLELDEWDRQQKRDRLVAVSLTGWQDMVNILDMSRTEEYNLRTTLKIIVKNAVEEYAKYLDVEPSLLSTTIKPEGTLSQLPTVASGLHYSHSPYYIRRVRINAHDPLAKVALSLGWTVHPEVGQTWEDANTYVIEFPVKSPDGRTKYEVSAIEQLENYKAFMEDYVEHNASITVTVRDSEWEDVEQWVWENWDSIVGITFLSLGNHTYPLAPYEAITEEEYKRRKAEMKEFNPQMLQKFKNGIFDEGDSECAGGACPVR